MSSDGEVASDDLIMIGKSGVVNIFYFICDVQEQPRATGSVHRLWSNRDVPIGEYHGCDESPWLWV